MPGRSVPGNRFDLLDGVAPERAPSVSVVVVHYRQQRELDRTLAALVRQTHPADRLEIVVVDDGSPEPPKVPDGVRLVRQEDDGFRLAAARNLGVRESTGDVLCFLDADTVPEPSYVERITRLPALLPEAVTVGRRRHAALDGHPTEAPIEQIGPLSELPEPGWLIDEYRRSRNLLDADHRSYRFMIGAVIACSRWLFERTGGFDESFRAYGGEDWEWAHRAWLEAAIFAHEPEAVAWHDGAEWSSRDVASDRARKNDETLRLAGRIPVTGSRGWAVRSGVADVLVRLLSAPSDAAAYVCVDSVLAALPSAQVVVPDDVLRVFADDDRVLGADDPKLTPRPRVVIDLPTPMRVRRGSTELVAATDEVGCGDLGRVELSTEAGVAAVVRSRRGDLRSDRWGDGLFRTERRGAPWLREVPEDPGLAAYLGGWDGD
ncbi:glycosyltransferase family 2 protein [Herbiconiux sp. L3-i23]|uniref:glycosyltransferase family 2 protein n=1 Tax=Herbiconiux sp. L3-i23 TaxID=2905871 RepID=UPI00204B4A2B|nr:glycosyltransferase [Herbiconiux sp. L3-i23]BDI24042.1 hypothetical protein L3i23_28180 [Herbiconiux sp. L3-i23]